MMSRSLFTFVAALFAVLLRLPTNPSTFRDVLPILSTIASPRPG